MQIKFCLFDASHLPGGPLTCQELDHPLFLVALCHSLRLGEFPSTSYNSQVSFFILSQWPSWRAGGALSHAWSRWKESDRCRSLWMILQRTWRCPAISRFFFLTSPRHVSLLLFRILRDYCDVFRLLFGVCTSTPTTTSTSSRLFSGTEVHFWVMSCLFWFKFFWGFVKHLDEFNHWGQFILHAGITMASSKTRKPPNAFNFLRQNDVLKKAGLDAGFDAPWPLLIWVLRQLFHLPPMNLSVVIAKPSHSLLKVKWLGCPGLGRRHQNPESVWDRASRGSSSFPPAASNFSRDCGRTQRSCEKPRHETVDPTRLVGQGDL